VSVILTKPVVALQRDTGIVEPLPIGAEVEFTTHYKDGVIYVQWKGRYFSVFREELLDACSVDAIGRIDWF
jgi:hypothetical protein